ncbi:MAG: hypothetical protein HEP71_03905 [Roseivirga sp.]|nr:hypothetical protein [Roseivirga sp.]
MNVSRMLALLASLLLFSSTGFGQESISNSLIAFTIPEKDLLPESVAYDSRTESFFVGSTRKGKVIKIDKYGKQTEFISQANNSLWMVIGMKVDSQRRHLWLCSSGGDNLIGYNRKDDKEGRPAGIFKFNLDNGSLIQKFVLDEPGKAHFFNDLIIAGNGDVYATHMFAEAKIYKISAEASDMEVFASDTGLQYPNGLALADNGKELFIAHSAGVSKLNLETKTFTSLTSLEGVDITRRASIDGLYYYKWSLIGVQSDSKQVIQLMLNEDGTGFKEAKVLEKGHPMMNRPTTGVLVGSEFYYIANAQFDNFNKDGSLFPMERMYEPVILKVNVSK